MANSSQAIKRIRQIKKREEKNSSQRSALRTAVKKALKLIQANDSDNAKSAFKVAVTTIDKASGRGILHPNKGARIKSRLHRKLKSI